MGQCDPPPVTFQAIDCGSSISCGLDSQGVIVCWGVATEFEPPPPEGAVVSLSYGHLTSVFGIEVMVDLAVVEDRGIEPLTSALRTPRSPS